MTGLRLRFRGVVLVALEQLALAAVLLLLLAVWLNLPDANAFEVLLSVVLALVLATVAGAGESLILLRLTKHVVTRRRLIFGAAAVLIAAALWYGVSFGLEKLISNDSLYAGYLNSRAPASMRNVFSYDHLASCLDWLCSGLRWLVAGLLGAPVFSAITCDFPARGLRSIFRSGQFWLALLLVFLAAAVGTGSLMNWTPGHGLSAETVSLGARLLLAILLNALAVGYLLTTMAEAVGRIQTGGGAAPERSQPRTAERP